TCSTMRSAEISRNAKMRPATAPSGSRMTASLRDSQISSPPLGMETSSWPAGVFSLSASSFLRCTSVVVRTIASCCGLPVTRSADRIRVAQPLVGGRVLDGEWRTRLEDVAGEPRRRGRTRSDSVLGPLAPCRADDELFVLERADGAGVPAEQHGSLLDHFVEH